MDDDGCGGGEQARRKMTGAESNGEMETKRNAVSFRGEINSFPFPSLLYLSLSSRCSFLPRTFPSISPPSRASTDCTCSLARSLFPNPKHTLTDSLRSVRFRLFSPTFDDDVAVAAKLDGLPRRQQQEMSRAKAGHPKAR